MKKILIADDDQNITTALSRRLKANGYDVLTAPDGFRALLLAREEKPDLMLLDMWMPIGIGLSVAERMQELGLDIPIIFLTACRATGLAAAARQVGAVAYLEKPYDPAHLLRTIEQALSRDPALATCG
jgi:DNA-binding response OmpR family regulator